MGLTGHPLSLAVSTVATTGMLCIASCQRVAGEGRNAGKTLADQIEKASFSSDMIKV